MTIYDQNPDDRDAIPPAIPSNRNKSNSDTRVSAPIFAPQMEQRQENEPRRRLNMRGWLMIAGVVGIAAQMFLPADISPAAFIGRTITIIHTQPNERLAVIETLKEQLSINRQLYSQTHAEAEAFKAKCGFLILLPGADEMLRQLPGGGFGNLSAVQACHMLFEINYGPQLRQLSSEAERIQGEIKSLEGAL